MQLSVVTENRTTKTTEKCLLFSENILVFEMWAPLPPQKKQKKNNNNNITIRLLLPLT